MARIVRWVVAMTLLLPCLAACGQREDMTALMARGYNHTDHGIVYSVAGGSGGYAPPHATSGGTCCVAIPRQWSPDMTVTVQWQLGIDDDLQTRVVPVPQFDGNNIAAFAVHFLRTGEIKVFATRFDLWHSDYPLQGEEALLYPQGESPKEIRDRARSGTPQQRLDEQIAQLHRDHITGGLSDAQLRPFVTAQIADAEGYGLEDLDDQYAYLKLAIFSSGAFVHHALVQTRLADRSGKQSFRAWTYDAPGEIFETGLPLWETLAQPEAENGETSR